MFHEVQTNQTAKIILEIESLSVPLPDKADREFAIQNINLNLKVGELLCIVGESGSGKSITAKTIMGLLPQPLMLRPATGKIRLHGKEILGASEKQLRSMRGREVGMIFQEPMTSLNLLFPIGKQIGDVLKCHTDLTRKEIRVRTIELLDSVKIPNPEKLINSYPFTLSGGQRQRVLIAMALANAPDILIADEPTTALDVTTQARILQLIKNLQIEKGMGVMFITHDFGVVAEIADRVIVMKEGLVIESGTADEILHNPQHEYTKLLIDSVPHGIPAKLEKEASSPILEINGMNKRFAIGSAKSGEFVQAVDNVSLTIHRGETFGIVGESGSGKSTLGRCAIRLIEADGGNVIFEEKNI